MDVLATMDIEFVIPHIENALISASKEEDFMWIGGIQRLVDRLQLSSNNFSSHEVYDLLTLADW